MHKLKWVTSDGRHVSRDFESIHDRTLFVATLYVNDYDKYGKISVSRPTQRALDAAKAWALKDNPYAGRPASNASRWADAPPETRKI